MAVFTEAEESAIGDEDEGAAGEAEFSLLGPVGGFEGFAEVHFFSPHFFAGFKVEADEGAIEGAVTVHAVEIAVFGDGVHEVGAECEAGPDFLGGAIGEQVEEGAAGAVAFGDEDLVSEDEWG